LLVFVGGNAIASIFKYILPFICMAGLIAAIVFGLEKKTIYAILAGIVSLVGGGLSIYTLSSSSSSSRASNSLPARRNRPLRLT
jgi:lipopolysaccharide export LptBFGC system permease protein LptF